MTLVGKLLKKTICYPTDTGTFRKKIMGFVHSLVSDIRKFHRNTYWTHCSAAWQIMCPKALRKIVGDGIAKPTEVK